MGKSSRHKSQNIHHFVPFSDRILNANTDVIHQIRRRDDEVETTFFGEALLKWTDLDLTDHFINFRKEIQGQVQTFEQLVHHKDEIIISLKTHLAVSRSLAVAPLLDLLVQLARDLQQEFVPHFQDFFNVLVRLLADYSQNAEILEQIFQTFACLFRFLWRYLVKDFKTVFSYFSQLMQSSQKDYIKVFAAESCAYLLRKVKHQGELLNMLFGSLKTQPELVDGVGLLLFEMVKGVNNRFHTISEKVFPLILQKLGKWNPDMKKEIRLPYNLVEKAVKVLMQECANHATKEHFKPLWQIMFVTVHQVHTAYLRSQQENEEGNIVLIQHLRRLLRLTSVWLMFDSGSIVSDAECIADTLCTILKSPSSAKQLHDDILCTTSNLLQTCHDRLSVGTIVQLNSAVLNVPFQFSVLRIFLKDVLNLPFFEKDVLPGLMNRLQSMLTLEDEEQKEILAFMVEIVMQKVKPPYSGEDVHLLKSYCHDSRSRSMQENSFSTYITSILTNTLNRAKALSASDLSLLWCAVVCSPHFCASQLQEMSLLWKELVLQIELCHHEELVKMTLAVLNQMLRSILISTLESELNMPVSYADILHIVRLRPNSPFSVQMLDLYLSCYPDSSLLTENHHRDVYTLLEPNLVSPSHGIRLITSHVLSIFPVDLPEYNDGFTREGIFKILYEAEKIVPTVHSYREKLVHLRKLDYNCIMKSLPSEFYRKAPLLFLLGNEFWNFKLLWEPLAELISSHAQGLDAEEFWEVMLNQLQEAAHRSERELEIKTAVGHSDEQATVYSLFTQHTSNFFMDTRQPDFANFRLQLWKAMKTFPDKCILKSDALCELYLNFLKNEFSAADEDSMFCQNILHSNAETCDIQTGESQVETETNMDAVMDDTDDEKPHVDIPVVRENETFSARRKPAIQSLLVHLELIALFKRQRSMFLQTEVQNSFYDLLKHRNSSVQKAAFECILSYKNPHIVPYKENFYRLLDDKTFKTEIVLFRVDEESTEIKETDRDELLPVLMRILYGKFHSKAGTDTSGKSRSNLRKSIVFSFLCGCKPEELIYFLKLLFQPFMHFLTDDPVKMVSTTLMDINFEKFIPLKRIKGVLNTVQAVSQKLGHRMVKFSHPLLHILLGLTTTVSAALTNRTIVLRGAVNLLKTLFHTAVNRITQFFENFENLDYTFEEIDAVFKVVVWPLAHKLATEGIHHPTPLLKLYLFWSQSKRFFPLLGHVKDSSAVDCTPMASIISLLKAPKINPSVEAAIMDLINNLLHIEDVDEQPMQPLPVPFAVIKEREHKTSGEHMLLPHISSLIMYLKDSLSKVTCGLSKTRQTFHTELKILGRISTAVTLPEECHALCELLISLLARGITLSQDTEENILLSLTNMIQYINNPEAFYRDISQLFCSVGRRESRTQLCRLFRVISEKDACLIKYVTLIEKLNAWDKRKTEEPDYFTRLEAFTEINSMLSNMEMVTIDILLPVVYNCCYFINHVDDMSIRDNSTHCLVCIVKCLAHTATEDSRKAFNIAIEKALVPQIKLGVRHKSEAVRHEFLTVLQNLVNNCPDNEMFTGLKHLCDKDTEADFFENIRHIQIHKRSRGLRRLYKHLKDHHFRAEIHMSYFIPLVYAFITDPSYSNHASVQDAAIDLLGAICKQLTWKYYLQLLRFYLYLLPKKIELQKQLVRVIVTLLDAFHFDLKNSNYNITITPAAVAGNMDSLDEGMQQEDTCTDLIPNELPSELEATQTPSHLLQTVVQPDEEEKTDEITVGSDIICSSAAATRIHKTIVTSLLPQLNKVVTHKANNDDVHKLAKSKYPEDEEILRVPLALAMIKLLQHLPGGTLENMLPGILLKICVFLRSRSRDVRASARDTIEKVALSLGARFLPFLLRELKATLTRGYQLHILSYTAYRLLKVLSSNMKPGDVDPSLISVQDIFYSELFGQTADEKEVDAIKSKYFEAQFIKAYDAYQLLATYVSPRNLNQLIQPIKGVLENTHSRHIANKAEVVLLKVAHGLMVNSSIPIETMMVFIKCWVTQSTSRILSQSSHKPNTDNKKRLQNKLPESCLLLSEAAPRGGFKPKASKETNTHVLVEFGLQLLHMCLKKSLLLPYEHLHLQLLDPLIPAIHDCLRSSHIKTTANCMRCLSWLLKFPLPSLKAHINKIVPDMFLVVQNYTGAATAKGGNQELITVCFKAVTVLVRDVTYYEVTENQLKVLLTYCEEDIYNYSRQSSAFNLIRAILSRKLDIPQLHQVMDRLFEMSTTASSSNVRLQSRQVILYYLLNYPLGKSLKKHLYYYIDNLNYELEEGRESAIEMMITMFSAFPQTILNNHCHRFFVALAMASFNDTSSKCRKLLMVALRTLIGKIDMKQRKTLFADVIRWMKSDVIDVCTMGNHVCGIFVEVEGGKFECYLSDLIPLLQLQLNPNKYTEKHEDASKTEQQDMCLVAVLNNLLKIVKELPFARQTNLNDQLHEIWGHVCSQLLYPHSQVRLLCSQLLGLLFSSWEPDEIAEQQKNACASDENQKPFYMVQDTVQLVKNCTRSFCQQLQTPHLDDILGTQVVKNILYLARLTEALGMLDILVWITKKVMKEANMEVISNVKVTVRRNYAFKWTAALGMSLKTSSVVSLLPYLLPPLQREMLANTQDASLKNLAQEVVDLLKKQVGVPEFTLAFASCHKWRQDKRESKKRIAAAEAVTNPDVSARKKIHHNLKKRVAVKRKIEEKRPTKKVKKNKLSILNVVVEDD